MYGRTLFPCARESKACVEKKQAGGHTSAEALVTWLGAHSGETAFNLTGVDTRYPCTARGPGQVLLSSRQFCMRNRRAQAECQSARQTQAALPCLCHSRSHQGQEGVTAILPTDYPLTSQSSQNYIPGKESLYDLVRTTGSSPA